MYIDKSYITPEQAKKMLLKNSHNRPLYDATVKKMRHDMEAGRWDENTPETISLDPTGVLLNGQHRLTALAGANVDGFNFWVAYDTPAESQESMDLGRPRSVNDVLRLRHPDIQCLTTVGAMIRWVTVAPEPGVGLFQASIKKSSTVHQMLNTFEGDPVLLQEAAVEAKRFQGTRTAFNTTAVAYCWYFIEKTDRGAAPEFFGAIRTLSFGVEDPRQAVFEKVQRVYGDPNLRSRSKEVAAIQTSVMLRGYNSWAKGDKVKLILSHRDGKFMEPVAPIKRKVKP